MISRRQMLSRSVASIAAGALLLPEGKPAAAQDGHQHHDNPAAPPATAPEPGPAAAAGRAGSDYAAVVTPNGVTLPWKLVDGVKVFHLIAEEVEHEFAPGLRGRCWGYNGRVHGPTIEAVEGDRLRIYVSNKLPAPTSVHWHGILLPSGMDGVAGLTQPIIRPGETFVYEFTLRQHGTHFYHPHHDEMTQMSMGMMGLFIIHPRNPEGPQPERDFALMLSEWRIDPGTWRPNPNEMLDFNLLTFNARAFPGTDALVVRLGQRVRIRLANGSATDHHPIHLHGYKFWITQTDGGPIPAAAWWPETTVLVPVGSSRTVEFVADVPGDWALHCHMTHHTMNQMGHDFPNMIGVDPRGLDEQVRAVLPNYMTMGQSGMGDMAEHLAAGHMPVPENSIPMVGGHGPFDYITMGGMFTVLKVRADISSYDDPGWYQHPAGTVAWRAREQEMRRDLGAAAPAPGHRH